MVNIDKYSRAQGKDDELSVYIGFLEIPVSNFSANFAFDAFSVSFSFDTPAVIQPFSSDEVEVYIGDTLLFTGLIFSLKADGTNYSVSGKSLTSILERSVISKSAVAWTLRDISPLDVANIFGQELGIEFTTQSTAARRNINQYEASDTATAADVISGICKETALFVSANSDNTAELKHLQSLGDELFTIDTESSVLPFSDLSVEYNSAALYSNYIGVSNSDENGLINTSERTMPQAPFYSAKIVKPSKNQDVETALDSEITKALISAVKVSFSIPFITHNGKVIKPYDTFHLTARRYGIENRQFSITDMSLSINNKEVKTTITACLSSALFGAWE